MVVTGEDHNLVATRHRAREAHRRVYSFRSGADKTRALIAREFTKEFRRLARERRLRSHLNAQVELVLQHPGDELRRVPEEARAESIEQINVLIVVDVPQLRAGRLGHDDLVNHLLPQPVETGGSARVGVPLAVLLSLSLRAGGALRIPLNQGIEVTPLDLGQGNVTGATEILRWNKCLGHGSVREHSRRSDGRGGWQAGRCAIALPYGNPHRLQQGQLLLEHRGLLRQQLLKSVCSRRED